MKNYELKALPTHLILGVDDKGKIEFTGTQRQFDNAQLEIDNYEKYE